jgi:hypothetical protein
VFFSSARRAKCMARYAELKHSPAAY